MEGRKFVDLTFRVYHNLRSRNLLILISTALDVIPILAMYFSAITLMNLRTFQMSRPFETSVWHRELSLKEPHVCCFVPVSCDGNLRIRQSSLIWLLPLQNPMVGYSASSRSCNSLSFRLAYGSRDDFQVLDKFGVEWPPKGNQNTLTYRGTT